MPEMVSLSIFVPLCLYVESAQEKQLPVQYAGCTAGRRAALLFRCRQGAYISANEVMWCV